MSSDGTVRAPRAALIVLGVAVLLLAGSIGWAALRGDRVRELPMANAQMPATVEALAERARARPDDAVAWTALGMAQFDQEDFADAATSLERAAALSPQDARIWSVLGEARVKASARDPMPPAALDAFRKALAIDPKDPPSRYFLAVHRDLGGDHEGAIADWLALLADTPPGAPWETDLRRTIAQVGKINGIEVADRLASVRQPGAPAATPGPTADQVREAAKLAPSEQDAMARGMVERLEARLAADPANLDGWTMLMRSRMTLGEPAKAAEALRKALAANPGARARLEAEAQALGVPR